MKAFKPNQQSSAAAPEEIQKLFPTDKRPFISFMAQFTNAQKKFSNVNWRCRQVKPPVAFSYHTCNTKQDVQVTLCISHIMSVSYFGVGKLVSKLHLTDSVCLFRYVRETPRLRHACALSHSLQSARVYANSVESCVTDTSC